MDIAGIFEELKRRAEADPAVREALLRTEEAEAPLHAFCVYAASTAAARTHRFWMGRTTTTACSWPSSGCSAEPQSLRLPPEGPSPKSQKRCSAPYTEMRCTFYIRIIRF